jgi:polar amino acid transport system substrate-binding protein
MRVLSIAFCILVCCPAAYGTGKPTVKACYEDENSYPWVLKDRLGLNILMLQMVAQQLDSKIETP